jgi:hypothetical protein
MQTIVLVDTLMNLLRTLWSLHIFVMVMTFIPDIVLMLYGCLVWNCGALHSGGDMICLSHPKTEKQVCLFISVYNL